MERKGGNDLAFPLHLYPSMGLFRCPDADLRVLSLFKFKYVKNDENILLF